MSQVLAPIHMLHVFQRPRQGRAQIAQYRASNWKHRIISRGGYDTASCSLIVPPAEAEDIFANFVGAIGRLHVDNPLEAAWEGYISAVTYRRGGIVLRRSLENMANKINVTYSLATGATENINTAVPGVMQNDASIAIYGLKEQNFEAGIHYTTNRTQKSLLRATLLSMRAWPEVSASNGSETGGAVIELEFRGLAYMVWDWESYLNPPATSGAIATVDAEDAFQRVSVRSGGASAVYLPKNAASIIAQGAVPVGSRIGTPYRHIALNPTFQINTASESGLTYMQYIMSIVEAGDGLLQWVYGLTAPDPNSGDRYAVYRQASTAVKYQVSALRDTGRLRDVYGTLVPGWLITPDAGVRIMDILVGYNQVGGDPRLGYIESVDYDGETGLVQFATGENITMEGILQRGRVNKPFSVMSRFGAPLRTKLV